MVVIAVMVFVGIGVAGLLLVGYLRKWGMEVGRTEARLHEPGAHTMSYAVPPGRDPAELMAAVRCAGFTVVEESPDRLLVDCPEAGDEAKVRRLLDETVGS